MGKPAGKTDPEFNQLKKKVTDLEELTGDHALAIRYLKKYEASNRNHFNENQTSVQRLASAFEFPASTAGRWTWQKQKRRLVNGLGRLRISLSFELRLLKKRFEIYSITLAIA